MIGLGAFLITMFFVFANLKKAKKPISSQIKK
jgi:hypothetical protein